MDWAFVGCALALDLLQYLIGESDTVAVVRANSFDF